ncbi:MAG: hypothetical protein GX585_05240, partial [Clostridiales bacterium]|nr:hypothetical protein [Clostridiales bacterium]
MGFRELSWRDRGRLWLRMLIRTALTAAVLLLLFLAGPPLLSLFMPFVLALLFAWLLIPIIRFLQKRVGGSRKVFSFVLVLFILGGVGAVLFALGYSIVTELVHLANNWGAIWVELEQVGIQFMGLFN